MGTSVRSGSLQSARRQDGDRVELWVRAETELRVPAAPVGQGLGIGAEAFPVADLDRADPACNRPKDYEPAIPPNQK